MKGRYMVAVVAGVLAGAQPVGADVLYLHNGDRIRGVIVREQDGAVTLAIGPKMQVQYGPTEVSELEWESADANAALKASWRGPAEAPADAVRGDADPNTKDEAAEEGEDAAAAPAPPPVTARAAAPTAEQRRREDLIDELDIDEELMTPNDLKATLGPPQVERHGLSLAGQKIIDFGYDIGHGLLRIVRFREMRNGYGATDTFDEAVQADDGAAAAGAEAESAAADESEEPDA